MPNGGDWQSDVLRDLRGVPHQVAESTAEPARSDSAPGLERPVEAVQEPAPVQGADAQPTASGRTGRQRQDPTPRDVAGDAPAPAPRAVPEARPVLGDGPSVALDRTPRHGESVTARAVRTLRHTLYASATREVAAATRTAEMLQRPVTTGRQIAVTSIRGGSGKTTVAALLGTAYAHYRQDPVLFLEADPALGSLPLRLGADTVRWTTGDLADLVTPDMTLPDVTGHLVPLPDNAWLLPASQGRVGTSLDSRAYERAVVALRRYFGVMVVDCETLPAEVARVALAAAHSRVLTSPATPEGVSSTYAVLRWMRELPRRLLAGTVVVLTEPTPHPGIDLAAAARHLRSTGAAVRTLPYDRHLASGGPIRTASLAHPTRKAAARLAAEIFHLAQQRH
ncbi:MinD/ParA family ATP-binding protein [Streptomyces monomycini]|uniref:MinD/ParA family ATP-binding protein n=1 Tax=Streptomyces monomycini TaxID=371720 RepID=UPI0004AA9141|nr:MinD/ParA family protein [Streptomyces monomycini]